MIDQTALVEFKPPQQIERGLSPTPTVESPSHKFEAGIKRRQRLADGIVAGFNKLKDTAPKNVDLTPEEKVLKGLQEELGVLAEKAQSDVGSQPNQGKDITIQSDPVQLTEVRQLEDERELPEKIQRVRQALELPLPDLQNTESNLPLIRILSNKSARHIEVKPGVTDEQDRRLPAIKQFLSHIAENPDLYRQRPSRSEQYYAKRPDGAIVHNYDQQGLKSDYFKWFDLVLGEDGPVHQQDYEEMFKLFTVKTPVVDAAYSTDIKDYFDLIPPPDDKTKPYPEYLPPFSAVLSDYFQERAGINYVLWQRQRVVPMLQTLYPQINWGESNLPIIHGAESVIEREMPLSVHNEAAKGYYDHVVKKDENGFFDVRDVNGQPHYLIKLEIAQAPTERTVHGWKDSQTTEILTDELLWDTGSQSMWLGETVPSDFSGLSTYAHELAHQKVQDSANLPHNLVVFNIAQEGFATSVELESLRFMERNAELLGISPLDNEGIRKIINLRMQRLHDVEDAYSQGYNMIASHFSNEDGSLDIESAYKWLQTINFEAAEKAYIDHQELPQPTL